MPILPGLDPRHNTLSSPIGQTSPFLIKDILDFGCLSWSAEAIALIYNYVRLSMIRTLAGKLEFKFDLCVSFPHALTLFQLVEQERSLRSSSLRGYAALMWETERTDEGTSEARDLLRSVEKLLACHPRKILLSPDEWKSFSLKTANAINSISNSLDRLSLLPSCKQEITPWHLELFFGRNPYQMIES